MGSEFTATEKGRGEKEQPFTDYNEKSCVFRRFSDDGRKRQLERNMKQCPQTYFPSSCCSWDPSVYHDVTQTETKCAVNVFGEVGESEPQKGPQDQLPTN